MKKAIIFAGGDFGGADDVKGYMTVCADGGYENACRAGVKPYALIGDMDSVKELPKDITLIRANPKKDETDTRLCVDYLAEMGYKNIDVVCGLGGRVDHELANITLAAYAAKKGIALRVLGENTEIFVIEKEGKIKGKIGDTVSLFPLGGDVEDIYTKGLEYALAGGRLTWHEPLGISNVMTQPEAEIKTGKGMLAVIHIGKR